MIILSALVKFDGIDLCDYSDFAVDSYRSFGWLNADANYIIVAGSNTYK